MLDPELEFDRQEPLLLPHQWDLGSRAPALDFPGQNPGLLLKHSPLPPRHTPALAAPACDLSRASP